MLPPPPPGPQPPAGAAAKFRRSSIQDIFLPRTSFLFTSKPDFNFLPQYRYLLPKFTGNGRGGGKQKATAPGFPSWETPCLRRAHYRTPVVTCRHVNQITSYLAQAALLGPKLCKVRQRYVLICPIIHVA